jgi:hypothetical protein
MRDGAIITDCEDYDLAIESFKVDLKTLPVIIPTIKYNELNENPRDTIYKVTVEVNHQNLLYSYSEHVEFLNQDKTISLPTMKNGNADYASGFYNIYNYEWFIVLVNSALKNAMNNLKTKVVNNLGLTISDFAPYFSFDKQTKLISLYAPRSDFEETNASPLSICLNKPLYRLFNSLPLQIKKESSITVDSNGTMYGTEAQEVFKINMSNFYLSNVLKLNTAPKLDGTIYESASVQVEYLGVYQDYSTFDTWSPVESIVITSNTIPIKKSIVSANHSFINGVETSKGSLNVYELSITDFKSGSYEGGIIYSPNEKRWLNMDQQKELKNINLGVYYRSKLTGALVPVKLNSGGSFSIKFLFRKPK